MKSAVFVSVRTKSRRLPRKVLLDIKGKTAIEHQIDRAKLPKLPDMVVMCTSTHPDDDVLADIARQNHIECFRGSEDDKLDRYLNAALQYGLDYMVIMDGDNVFLEPDIVDQIIDVGVCCRHVAGLDLHVVFDGLFAKRFFNFFYEFRKLHRAVIADVVDFIAAIGCPWVRLVSAPVRVGFRDSFHDAYNPFNDVIDVCEITLHFSMVENLDGFPC